MRRLLMPLATWSRRTDGGRSAARAGPCDRATDARDAARRARRISAQRPAIVKGGHFDEPDIVDLLFDGRDFHEFRHRAPADPPHARHRLHVRRGAGRPTSRSAMRFREPCARDRTMSPAPSRMACAIGHGHGPLDHFWRAERRVAQRSGPPRRTSQVSLGRASRCAILRRWPRPRSSVTDGRCRSTR